MFSRRHPVLFFVLMFSAISAAAMVAVFALVIGGSAAFNASFSSALDKEHQGNVGVVEITGLVASSRSVVETIKKFREDEAIKAIVLRINSPGGGVGPAQEIYREVVKTGQEKNVVASLGAVAASGGYYAASAADKIMANPGTITGSIGVIMEYANFQKILKKIGLSPVVIKSGEFKDLGSPARELTEEERTILQGVADEIHMQFVNDVALGRDLAVDTVKTLADGRIYTGEKALELNLVDRLGNLGDAVQWAGRLGGVQGEIVPVYPKEDRIQSITRLFESLFKAPYITGAISDYFGFVIN